MCSLQYALASISSLSPLFLPSLLLSVRWSGRVHCFIVQHCLLSALSIDAATALYRQNGPLFPVADTSTCAFDYQSRLAVCAHTKLRLVNGLVGQTCYIRLLHTAFCLARASARCVCCFLASLPRLLLVTACRSAAWSAAVARPLRAWRRCCCRWPAVSVGTPAGTADLR